MTVVLLHTGLWVGHSPKGGDARRTNPPGSYSEVSATHHRARLAAPAEPLASSKLHQPALPQG